MIYFEDSNDAILEEEFKLNDYLLEDQLETCLKPIKSQLEQIEDYDKIINNIIN